MLHNNCVPCGATSGHSKIQFVLKFMLLSLLSDTFEICLEICFFLACHASQERWLIWSDLWPLRDPICLEICFVWPVMLHKRGGLSGATSGHSEIQFVLKFVLSGLSCFTREVAYLERPLAT